MFALRSHWFLFLFLFLEVDARPTRPTTFISLPLQKFYLRDMLDDHPAIVHHHSVNAALRRYARMTGRSEPAHEDLFKNLIDRVSTIPPSAVQKRYNREGLDKILNYVSSNSDKASAVLSGVKPAKHTAFPSGTGKSGHSHANVTSIPPPDRLVLPSPSICSAKLDKSS